MKSANRKRLTEALDSFRESETEFYQGHKERADEARINRLWDFFQFDLNILHLPCKGTEDEKMNYHCCVAG